MELIINHTVETALAVVRNPQKTAKGCCERYNTNDDVVGRWLAAAVKSQQINGYKQLHFYIIS